MLPIRRFFSPFLTRQTAANFARSSRNSSESGSYRVGLRQRVRDPVLAQVVACRHLSAEAVAPMRNRHLLRRVRRGLHEHRHVEIGQSQCVCNGALVPEIGQRDNYAVDTPAPCARNSSAQRLASSRVSTAPCLLCEGSRTTASMPACCTRLDHLFAAGLCQLPREKSAIADDDSHRHFRAHTHDCVL